MGANVVSSQGLLSKQKSLSLMLAWEAHSRSEDPSTGCYQNYLERRSEWDEERKNKLARLYESSVSPSALPLNSPPPQPFAAAWGAAPGKASICIYSSPSTVLERSSLLYLHP